MVPPPAQIASTNDLYNFLNTPTPIYGIITSPLAINFDFISTYKKVLVANDPNIKITATIYY